MHRFFGAFLWRSSNSTGHETKRPPRDAAVLFRDNGPGKKLRRRGRVRVGDRNLADDLADAGFQPHIRLDERFLLAGFDRSGQPGDAPIFNCHADLLIEYAGFRNAATLGQSRTQSSRQCLGFRGRVFKGNLRERRGEFSLASSQSIVTKGVISVGVRPRTATASEPGKVWSGGVAALLADRLVADKPSRIVAAADEPVLARLLSRQAELPGPCSALSQTATIDASFLLADRVLGELGRLGPLHKESVQQAGFLVLKSPDIPSILVETAFITNPSEERRLKDPAHQRRIASAIFSGLHAYALERLPGTRLASNAAEDEPTLSLAGDPALAP